MHGCLKSLFAPEDGRAKIHTFNKASTPPIHTHTVVFGLLRLAINSSSAETFSMGSESLLRLSLRSRDRDAFEAVPLQPLSGSRDGDASEALSGEHQCLNNEATPTSNNFSAGESSDNDSVPANDKSLPLAIPTTILRRSFYSVVLVSIYSTFSILGWTSIAIMSFRPLTTRAYQPTPGYYKEYITSNIDDQRQKYLMNDRLYRNLGILQSILAVITIPVTSAVCTKAAVIFMQRTNHPRRLTMRQMMALADKGWTHSYIVSGLILGEWARY